MEAKAKSDARMRRHARVRKKVRGEADRPRLAVLPVEPAHLRPADRRSRRAHPGRPPPTPRSQAANPTERAKAVGELLATRAKDAGIETAVFDRGGRQFHGRVAALADGAREGGLQI